MHHYVAVYSTVLHTSKNYACVGCSHHHNFTIIYTNNRHIAIRFICCALGYDESMVLECWSAVYWQDWMDHCCPFCKNKKKMIHFLSSLCDQVWATVSFFSWSIALDHFSYFHVSAKELRKLTTHGQHPKFMLPSSESQTPSSSTTTPENITGTSYWARLCLKSSASRLFIQSFIQTQIKENIKAPRYWPMLGEFTGEFPAQRASNAKNYFIWWRHHYEHQSHHHRCHFNTIREVSNEYIFKEV